MNNFLPQDYNIPQKDYNIQQKSNYTRLQDGENVLRILESPVLGWKLWVGGKPLRRIDESFTTDEKNRADINQFTDRRNTPQHFWAMVVWNYNLKRLQIWEVTQKGIMRDLRGLSKSKWGSPTEYDITVNKTGEKMDVTYSLLPSPKEKLEKSIENAYKEAKIDINKLFDGDDPFKRQAVEAPNGHVLEPSIFNDQDLAEEVEF